jgi:hypothetical protein
VKKLSQQAMCNRVVRHLYKQGVPCFDKDGDCVIRTADGKMCAAGAALPRAVAKQQTDRRRSDEWQMVQNDYPFLQELVDIHDSTSRKKKLSRLAIRAAVKAHGLKMPPGLR